MEEILNILKKKDKGESVCISGIIGCKKGGYLNA